MSWLSFLKGVKTVALDAKNIFVKIFGQQVADEFATTVKAIVATDLGTLAIDAVTYIEATSPTLGSTAKRDAAAAKLTADASSKGVALLDSVANLLIEIAVAYVKGSI